MNRTFTTRGAFGSDQNGAFCPYRMDVTPNGDDPDSLTGIIGYKALTFRECVYIYWMMKSISVSGSASYSCSSSMTGDYERITKTRQPDGSYTTEVADSFSGTAEAQSFSLNDTLQIDSSYYYDQRVPVEPEKRVCQKVWNNERLVDNTVRYQKAMKENRDDNDYAYISGNNSYPRISASTAAGLGLYYYYGYYVNDKANVTVNCPSLRFYEAYDDGNFVGYVMRDLCSWDISVQAQGSGRVPLSSSSARRIFCSVHMGGFGGISSLLYTDKYSMWEDSQISSTVNFGGFDFFAYGLGGPFNIDGSNGVKFSYSDSDSDSASYDFDNKDEDGAGITFTGEGECEARASFSITFKEPEYWDYPS